MEHDVTTVSQSYHPLFRSGKALGADRWLASLQRQCEYLVKTNSLGTNGESSIVNQRTNKT
jgi:homeobox-leucine zipper protein